MKFTPVKSSTVEAIGYDAASKLMHVRFKSGHAYAVHGVTPGEHARFMAAESKGKHYAAVFRNGPKRTIKRLEER